jgi:glucokinase
MKYCFGIDIGGTKCSVILGNAEGTVELQNVIIEKVLFETDNQGPVPVIEKISQIMNEIIGKYSINILKDLVGIGISCGGPLDCEKGVIIGPPNLCGWDNVPINKIFEDKYGVKVKLENDANACAIAEWKFGAAQGYKNIVFLTFGTGLGAGLILNGAIYHGTNGMAGEVGHIRLSEYGPVGYGKMGSFEGFCSGSGIAQIARIKLMEEAQMGRHPSWCPTSDLFDSIDAKMVANAAINGDSLAKQIYSISGEYLGKGLAYIVDILNPEVIVIGSIFQRNQGLLWKYTAQSLEKESLTNSFAVCKVLPAALGDSIGDYAAISTILGNVIL